MAKIKISESELRQLIGESVVSVLNEAGINYGMDWDKLSEPEREAVAKKWNLYAGLVYKYPDGTTGKTETRINPTTGQQERGTVANDKTYYAMDAAKERYNKRRARAIKNKNLSYSSNQYNNLQTQYSEAESEIERLNREVQAKNSAIQAIYNVAGIGRNPAPNQAKALENIGRWKRDASQWYNYQKQLKSQQAQNTANTTTNTVASNTTQTTAENQRGYSEA